MTHPRGAEATADKDAVITEVNANKTKIGGTGKTGKSVVSS